MMNLKTLEISEWETPATKYPLKKLGRARIRRQPYSKGYYIMEGVAGYEYFEVKKPIQVTSMILGRECVMVDDPLHWIGMQELARYANGNVITAGLGLGLITHALLEKPLVKSITVVEREQDVIDLIKPQLPESDKLKIIRGNIFDEISVEYQTIILDVWWGEGSRELSQEMISSFAVVKTSFPQANVYVWGLKDPSINPAVAGAI